MQAAEPQQQRHDEVIAYHGRQRHGLDDDHTRCRREAADEGKKGQHRHVLLHRYGQHERIGVHAAVRERQQPDKGDGQHENVDGQQVEGEEPHRLPEVALVDILHHQHLELPRQDDNGSHRK